MLNPATGEEQTQVPAFGVGAIHSKKPPAFGKQLCKGSGVSDGQKFKYVPPMFPCCKDSILRCIRRHASWYSASSLREVNFLLCQVLLRPHLEWWVQLSSPQKNRDMSILVQWTSTKGAEHLSYEEMLRQMGLFTQRIESSRISSSLAKIPDEKMQRAWNQTFFSMMPSDRTEGNGPKRENGKFISKARKTEVFHFVPELWSRQPYRAEDCIASKTWLGRGSKHIIWVMIFLKSKWIYLGKVQVF